MLLNQAKTGQCLKILKLPSELKAKLIRIGICEGDQVCCASKIPAGPVVLLKDLQEIAIGDKQAAQIKVEICQS
ncbi:MAG: ferrous iron transport protein A [Candidatus Melainabacteria bacterium]|nr:ferrous iron transport protein A [Candidatus Melainabacteria bacterium]